MKKKLIFFRAGHSRKLFACVVLSCWVSIVLVYLIFLSRSSSLISSANRQWLAKSSKPFKISRRMLVERSPPLALPSLGPSEPEVLLASAYLDPRISNTVRVHAVGRVGITAKLYCYLAFSNGTGLITEVASMSSHLTGQKVNYDGFFIDCPLPPHVETPFQFISVSPNESWPSSKFLRIQMTPMTISNGLAACLCPLHGSAVLTPLQIVSWIEINRLIGVEHFVLYNYTAPASLRPIFQHYNKLGLVQLLEWHLHPVPTALYGSWPPFENKLHYFGQFASNNECLYRLMHHYRYIMFSDMDELIVPTEPYQSLTKLLAKIDSDDAAAFNFRNVYLRSDYATELGHHNVTFLKYTRREQLVRPKDVGPKLIVKADRVMRMGVHDVIEFNPNKKAVLRVVEPEEGLLLHYKSPPAYLSRPSDTGVRDARVVAYRKQLLQSIERTMSAIKAKTQNADAI